jgi:hypothetical protein
LRDDCVGRAPARRNRGAQPAGALQKAQCKTGPNPSSFAPVRHFCLTGQITTILLGWEPLPTRKNRANRGSIYNNVEDTSKHAEIPWSIR